jgi:tetratricopeptide (TPR) repeat protein/tRNA A-37 threonylcarbamoyl transferase component Bud32
MDRSIETLAFEAEQISRFRIVERLGSGAMGVVYRARDTMLKRDVALKLILPDLADSPSSRARFLRECQTAASINHPGIATIYEAGETEEGWLYLASELVTGEVLSERIARGALPPDEAIGLGVQLAEALASAHATGVVHRDIKPANLMVTENGRLKVLDFGLARLLDGAEDAGGDEEAAAVTREGLVVGTPAYMSPEQAAGMKVDARTDIFAAGCVIYEMLSGISPFRSDSLPETIRRIMCEAPPALSSSGIRLPIGVEEIVGLAIAKERDDRYQSADELAVALREVESSIPGGAAVSMRRGWPRWALRAAVGLVLLVVVLVLARNRFWERPALAFHMRDQILITSIDNQTGDEAFDLALRTALEADLQQSPYARVFDQSQVADTLRLMRKDPSSVVGETLGRDVCRFAGVRAMLLPRILSVGEAFELQAVLVDPESGRHVDRFRVSAMGREEVLLTAIDELSRLVRTRLGESLESIEKTDMPVTDVTTSSWMALRYFALSNVKWGTGDFGEAAALLEMAIEKDPQFATAKGSFGLLLIQFLNQPEKGKQLLREALEEGGSLPEDEYLMIKAANRHFVDQDLEGALEQYELICDLFPDHGAAYNNRGRIELHLGRYDDANELFWRAAEVDPYGSVPLINVFFLNIGKRPDAVAAEAAARRLVELGPEIPGYRSMLGWSLAAQTRFSEADVELRLLLEWEPDHQYGFPNMAHVLFAQGRAEEALPRYRRLLELVDAGTIRASRVAAGRDLLIVLMAAGEISEAGALAAVEAERIEATIVDGQRSAKAQLALVHLDATVGRVVEARSRLAGLDETELESSGLLYDLATAHALLGDEERAIDELGRSLKKDPGDYFVPLVLPPFHDLLDNPRFLALFNVHH